VAFSFTEDFEFRYYATDQRLPDFPDRAVLNHAEQVNRLTAYASAGVHSAYVQVDEVALLANRYYLDDVLVVERELVAEGVFSPMPGESYLNVEKLRYSREDKGLSINLGDSYTAFGRGIALNVNRNVDIDIDTSIQGVRAVFRPGTWDITAIIGQLNRQQVLQDNPNVELRGDFRHAVGGLRVERFGLGPANLGVHGVAYDFVSDAGLQAAFDELGGTPDAIVGGATVELIGVGGLDWYVEGDAFGYPTSTLFGGAETQPGFALYASSTAYVGSTTWQLEGKRYSQSERVNAVVGSEAYRVSVGPTLEYERVITEDSAAAVGSNDISGARLRVDWTAIPVRLVPYVAVGVYRDEDLTGLHFNEVPETILHPVGGVEALLEHMSLLLNAGYRVDDRDGSDGGADRLAHADVDFKFPLPAGLHGDLALAGKSYQWGINPLQQTDFVDVETAVSVQKGSAVALTWFTDVTTNPLVESTGNLADAVYGAAELQVKPTSSVTLKAFYGAYKAGIRCSGGQCRLLPGFDGVRFSAVAAF
jgi:hypothetical protein